MDELGRARQEFELVRDELEPGKLLPILKSLLDFPSSKMVRQSAEYFQILEDVLYAIFESYGGGTVPSEERERIFGLLKDSLKPNEENEARASLQTIAGLLIPHPGVQGWLSELAHEEKDPDRKAALSQYAKTIREAFVI